MRFNLQNIIDSKLFTEFETDNSDLDIKKINSFIFFMKISAELSAELQLRLVDFKLSTGKVLTLLVLCKRDGGYYMPSEIADLIGVTRGTMTGLIDGLERDQYVIRSAHDSDQRKIFVSITENGKKILKEILPFYYRLLSQMLESFTREDADNLVEYAMKLRQELEKPEEIHRK